METGLSAACFVSRHHEPPPATLEELLRVSTKRASVEEATIEIDEIQKNRRESNIDDDSDSDSDYQLAEYAEHSEDDFDDSEPEVDEWRLHAVEPLEGLYVHEMKRQRGRMGEKEAQWVRGYLKAQRAWKARTGHSIDEFLVPDQVARRMQKTRLSKASRSWQVVKSGAQLKEEEDEVNLSLLTGVTPLESLLLLAAVVFVCLSLAVQLHVSIWSEQKSSTE